MKKDIFKMEQVAKDPHECLECSSMACVKANAFNWCPILTVKKHNEEKLEKEVLEKCNFIALQDEASEELIHS